MHTKISRLGKNANGKYRSQIPLIFTQASGRRRQVIYVNNRSNSLISMIATARTRDRVSLVHGSTRHIIFYYILSTVHLAEWQRIANQTISNGTVVSKYYQPPQLHHQPIFDPAQPHRNHSAQYRTHLRICIASTPCIRSPTSLATSDEPTVKRWLKCQLVDRQAHKRVRH
jgi:hypothetical protein